jgi:hypothetical protein
MKRAISGGEGNALPLPDEEVGSALSIPNDEFLIGLQ